MLRRYTCSILLPLLLLPPPLTVAAPPSATCPYDIPRASRMIPKECYANATTPSSTSCCWFVYGAYIYAASLHANLTGAAFLSPATAASCSFSFSSYLIRSGLVQPSLILPNSSCEITGDSVPLSASGQPCEYPTVNAIRQTANLSLATNSCAAGNRNLNNYTSCKACQDDVIDVVFTLLSVNQSKEFVPCGMAATIGIWGGFTPSIKRFESYLLCMVKVLENIGGLGTSNLLPSPPPPSQPQVQQVSESSSTKPKNSSVVVVVSSAVSASVFAVFLFCIGFGIHTRWKKQRAVANRDTSDAGDDDNAIDKQQMLSVAVLPRDGLYIFTRSELNQATNGYDPKLLLGEGGAGKVYLGTLPSGQRVAIKRLYREKKLNEFYKEIEVLAKLRQRNLTSLLGYCLSSDENALVYEYMAGGNLSTALHHGELTWYNRIKIAADVAEGLNYLHNFSEGPVIHRDVKPTNILLSEKWDIAKLSDFGVSRVVVDGVTHLTTEVRGTMGYVDPESFAVGRVSEATDIYSYGVVLLELITGMKAVVATPSGGAESIVNAAAATEGLVVVDPRMSEDEWDLETAGQVFETAIGCVRQNKNQRPKIEEVLAVLRAVLANLEARQPTEAVTVGYAAAVMGPTTNEELSGAAMTTATSLGESGPQNLIPTRC